jgi:hypothetical protein
MKAKQTPVASAVEVEIRSLKDAGYAGAKFRDGAKNVAGYILSVYPTFHESQPDEAVDQLVEGFKLQFHEASKEYRGDRYFKISDGVAIAVADETAGSVKVNVYVAMSHTQQAFGKLKDTDPGLHSVIKPVRDAFNKYKSDTLKAIVSQCKKLSKPEGNNRGATKAFLQAITDELEKFDARVRNAKDRGDPTADPVKYRMARDAFMKAYNV